MKFGTREIVLLVLLMMMPVASWWFVFHPRDQRNANMRTQIEARQEKLRQLNQAIGAAHDLQLQIDSLTEAIDYFKSRLPEEKEIDKILRDISRLAKSNNLSTKSIRTLNRNSETNFVSGGGQSEQPIAVRLTGDFEGFYSFLLALEAQPRIMRISKMDLEASKKGPAGMVTARFEMSIFFEKSS